VEVFKYHLERPNGWVIKNLSLNQKNIRSIALKLMTGIFKTKRKNSTVHDKKTTVRA